MGQNFFVMCRTGKGLYVGYHYTEENPAREAETFFRDRGEDVEFFSSASDLLIAKGQEVAIERHAVIINSGGRNIFDIKALAAQEQA
jgi:hypothetical protein